MVPESSAAATKTKKMVARVAVIRVDSATATVLRDCFRQFGIETVSLGDDAPKRVHKEKFEACVVPLDDDAEPVLQAMRSSPSNLRGVIYGVAESAQAALRFSKYGINAVLPAPLDRAAALKIVRSTYFLVLHEFRRYVRVPITTEVKINARSGNYRGVTLEMSGGGMSAEVKPGLQVNESAELSFSLPGQAPTRVNAVVCWLKPADGQAGFRFDLTDERRAVVKKWIEDYLEIA